MTDTLTHEEQPHAARPGVVYILTNDSIPGLVKIGRTSRDVDLRASELWQTGVPTPFEVYWTAKTINFVELERWVHRDLRKHRVHKFREFFSVEPEIARQKLHFWVCQQAHMLVSENFDCVVTEPIDVWVSSSVVERLVEETGQPNRVIVDALQCLTAAEIAQPVQRVIAQMEEEHRASLLALDIPEDEHWSVFE